MLVATDKNHIEDIHAWLQRYIPICPDCNEIMHRNNPRSAMVCRYVCPECGRAAKSKDSIVTKRNRVD